MDIQKTALLRKLSSLVTLDADDHQAVCALPFVTERVSARRDVLKVGQQVTSVYVLLEGWAARYGIRAAGSRRITGVMLPGDFCGIHALSGAVLDHGIVALTDCEIGRVDSTLIANLAHQSPVINQALWRSKLLEESILRIWLLNSDSSYQAVGHLLCELHARAHGIGLVDKGHCRIPLTQQDIGDAMGITSVHTNRVLQKLRGEKLIEFERGNLHIPDVEALRRACDFRPAYLHPMEVA